MFKLYSSLCIFCIVEKNARHKQASVFINKVATTLSDQKSIVVSLINIGCYAHPPTKVDACNNLLNERPGQGHSFDVLRYFSGQKE